MIAEETYDKLKKRKEAEKISFTKMIEKLLVKDDWEKRRADLLALEGALKDIPGDKLIDPKLKEMWARWTKQYA